MVVPLPEHLFRADCTRDLDIAASTFTTGGFPALPDRKAPAPVSRTFPPHTPGSDCAEVGTQGIASRCRCHATNLKTVCVLEVFRCDRPYQLSETAVKKQRFLRIGDEKIHFAAFNS